MGSYGGGGLDFGDVFPYDHKFVRTLFEETHTLFIGDSLMRGVYKDILSQISYYSTPEERSRLCPDRILMSRMEPSCFGDRQIDMEPYQQDRVFVQAREYQDESILMQFHFTTRVFKVDMENMLARFKVENRYPDIVYISSCLWDISRYHEIRENDNQDADDAQGQFDQRRIVSEYVHRFELLFRRMRAVLPASTTIVLVLMPHCCPSKEECAFNNYNSTRASNKMVLRALFSKVNNQAAQIARKEGFSVVDLDFYMRHSGFEDLRVKDGIHWNSMGTRFMTQLIIHHFVRDQEIELPPYIRDKFTHMFDKIKGIPKEKTFYHGADDTYVSSGFFHRTDERFGTADESGRQRQLHVVHRLPFHVVGQKVIAKGVFDRMDKTESAMIANDITLMRAVLAVVNGIQLATKGDFEKLVDLALKGQQAAFLGSGSLNCPKEYPRHELEVKKYVRKRRANN